MTKTLDTFAIEWQDQDWSIYGDNKHTIGTNCGFVEFKLKSRLSIFYAIKFSRNHRSWPRFGHKDLCLVLKERLCTN